MAARNTYSRVVAWAKVILPLLALALLSTLFLFSNSPDPERAIPFAEVDVEELAREQSLGNPRMAGTLPDGREVIFTAERAAPVLTDPRLISASTVEARINLDADAVLSIRSGEALIDTRRETVDLGEDVDLSTSSGFRLTTAMLRLDLAASTAEAAQEVYLTGPGLELRAGSMRLHIVGGNDVALFNGGVRVLYDPQS